MTPLRRWLARPLSDRDRQRAFALAAAALVLAAAILTITGNRPGAPTASTPPPSPAAAAPDVSALASRAPAWASAQDTVAVPAAVRQQARRFLAGYLPYLYGRRPRSARWLEGAGWQLRRRLAAERPRVAPAARRRRPRAVALKGEQAPSGGWQLRARIADGRSGYQLTLLVVGGRVVAIGGA